MIVIPYIRKTIYYNNKPTRYYITNYGKVYNALTHKEIKQELSINGYYIVRLSFKKYKRTEMFVHRLMATYFVPNPFNKDQVHHKDKNKLNNYIDNLMWVTKDEHKKLHENDENHPFARNELHPNSKLSNDQVHQICQFIQENKYTTKELANMFNVHRQVIEEIRIGNNWADISKNYNFDNYTKLEWIATDENKVHEICIEIVNNELTIKGISKKLNVREEIVRRIYLKKSFQKITNKYDFSKNTVIKIKKVLTKEELEYLKYIIKENNDMNIVIKKLKDNKINISERAVKMYIKKFKE